MICLECKCDVELLPTERQRVWQCPKCFAEWHRKPTPEECNTLVDAIRETLGYVTMETAKDKKDLKRLERRIEANKRLVELLKPEQDDTSKEAIR